jgi:RHS repeat-associated protein
VSYTNTFTPAKQIASAAISNSAYVYSGTTTTTHYFANGLNQYTNVGGLPNTGATCGGTSQAFTYDCNGSLTSDGTFNYTYDPENRLATSALRAGGMSATYTYDALGRRYQKAVTGGSYAGTTGYLDSGDDEIAEYNGATLLRRYVPGPSVDRPIAMLDYTVTPTATAYFYTDRQGSVIAMADGSGAKTEGPYTYDAYGRCLTSSVPCAGGVPFKYTGRRIDPETGLYFYRARYYSAALGRFLQTDPVGYSDDLNWYAYVGNDPTDRTDPSGDSPLEIVFFVGDAAQLVSDISSGASPGEIAMSVANVAIDAVAVASPVPGISEVAHVAEAAEKIEKVAEVGEKAASEVAHGNSLKSTAEQHRYEISEKSTGKVEKTGISGGRLNKNGTSRRANSQVNKLNKQAGYEKYQADVKETGIPGRAAALESEKNATRELKESGNPMSLQQKPY